jgi:hypothetical protein
MNKRIGLSDHSDTLAALAACRKAMVSILSGYPARHPIYREANALIADIDALGTLLTGKSDYFHLPGHSSLGRGP